MEWVQIYDPLGHAWLSTLAAAVPIVVLLGALALLDWPAHRAAIAGLISALLVAILVYGMPAKTAVAAAIYGASYAL
jgi:lactate permease